MEDRWAAVKDKAKKRALEHGKKMRTPAMYSLEVFISTYALEGLSSVECEDVKVRYKFLDFACVELSKNPEESDEELTDSPASPATPRPTEPDPNPTTDEPTTEGKTEKLKPEDKKPENLKKEDSKQNAGASETDETSDEPLPTESAVRRAAVDKLKADPRYFDPSKLLKWEAPLESQQGGEIEELAEEESTREVTDKRKSATTKPNSQKALESNREGFTEEDASELDSEEGEEEYSPEELEDEEDADVKFSDEIENAQLLRSGKTLIFVREPLSLLSSLARNPLAVIFFRPPSQVVGIIRVTVNTLTEAVDKSVVLTKSIPLTGMIRNRFDIMLKGRKVGAANMDIRLTCFGPYLFHKINVRDNPNDQRLELPQRSSSQRLIVVQLSNTKLGPIRHKSKLLVTKSNPTLTGRIQRDISDFQPLVCSDELVLESHLLIEPLVERGDEDVEAPVHRPATATRQKRKEAESWNTIFKKQVVRDLIAKDRRPFQRGSPGRVFVKSFVPELFPVKKAKPAKQSLEGCCPLCSQKETPRDDPVSLKYLALDKAWMNGKHLEKIRKKCALPQVRTSVNPKNTISGASLTSGAKSPRRSLSSMSHVAVNRFDMLKEDFGRQAEVMSRSMFIRGDSQSADPNRLNKGLVFNTKVPRFDRNLEKFNPIPNQPYAVGIVAPERSPSFKLVQSIRAVGKEIEAIGGDALRPRSRKSWQQQSRLRSPPQCSSGGAVEQSTLSTRTAPQPNDWVLIEVPRGTPLAVPARSTPYWEGHAPACDDPANCKHFLLVHSGFGYYGK